ncbi:NADPH-dependent F420 reductase [Planomonospora parontospora]|uniref:NADPH-dependent F420 reductase n=1 Tax=Planomonospora parontospora TaxID=58119 RepID=UPI001670A539|nr:NAD(P)-binding domain-containing protein [Planomonospora parontospora]GGL40602.1 hypothetical protein GCM10014719_47210 [Planomonospora parontospora subsp. antibiotica]GII18246.1 hypothetical protein Ppa05_49720 [Planomonospora parontospora subsp. antibiotica]
MAGTSRPEVPSDDRGSPVLGVIGCGSMGAALAELFAARGFPLYLAGGRRRTAQALAARLPSAVAASPETVASAAQVLVLATPVHVSRTEIAPDIGHRLGGKVLLDVSNPTTADLHGTGYHSAAELIADAFPKSSVVKGLNCVSARQIRAFIHGGPPFTVPVTGDEPEAKRCVARILDRAGFDVADAGPLSNSRWIEGLTELLRRIGQEEGLGDAVGFRLLRLGREHTHSEPRGHPLPGSTSASRKENRK